VPAASPLVHSQHIRYQVFLSSTFEDLREERQEVTEALLNMRRCIPAGMELFGASSLPPWHIITRVLDLTDYFVLVLGSRYGSRPPESALSYTEMEYDYALQSGLPVLAFAASPSRAVRPAYAGGTEEREALERFRDKVAASHLVQEWYTAGDLALKVTSALWSAFDDSPRPGWVRNSFATAAQPDLMPPQAALDAGQVSRTYRSELDPTSTSISADTIAADDAVRGLHEPSNDVPPPRASVVPGVAKEGQDTVKEHLAQNPSGDLFLRYLVEIASWPSVRVHGVKRKSAAAGEPLDYSRYLRLRKDGSRFGGFAYVWAIDGTLNLRLSFDTDEELRAIAPDAWRLHSGHREYRVNIRIEDESTLEQGLKLSRAAYEAT
jgi:hypothetical protein